LSKFTLFVSSLPAIFSLYRGQAFSPPIIRNSFFAKTISWYHQDKEFSDNANSFFAKTTSLYHQNLCPHLYIPSPSSFYVDVLCTNNVFLKSMPLSRQHVNHLYHPRISSPTLILSIPSTDPNPDANHNHNHNHNHKPKPSPTQPINQYPRQFPQVCLTQLPPLAPTRTCLPRQAKHSVPSSSSCSSSLAVYFPSSAM